MDNGDVESVAMMRGGDVDVEPFLVSRNTLGNGKTANSKSQTPMSNGGSGLAVVVAEVLVETRSKWVRWRKSMVGLYTLSEWKSRSLSSRNTLGDTSHNSNNLKCNGDQNELGCGSLWWNSG